jgi:hypothetical protein
MKDLRLYGSSRIDTLEMQKYLGINEYDEFVKAVRKLEDKETIRAIKCSRTNGKKPPLYNCYAILKEKADYSCYNEELKYKLNYELNTEYYRKNMKRYMTDRDNILKFSNFLNNKRELLKDSVSINERSFQIWGREKYLKGEGGTLLKRLKFAAEKLNYYDTSEPLAYFSYCKTTPQNVLMVENKDTFYTIRRYMINAGCSIFGEEIGTVIYGAGKGISKSLKDFELSVEPFLLNKNNRFLYLGDIDYEGIKIYEQLYESFRSNFDIKPFVNAYEYMVDKAVLESINLPKTKEGQNRNIKNIFLGYFRHEYKDKIESILLTDKYIPQEIISYADLKAKHFGGMGLNEA